MLFGKFQFVCNNEKEWVDIQNYLFSLGYKWENSGKNINTFPKYVYPRIIQNYRTDDKFGMRYLIITNQHWEDTEILPQASKLLRKLKLEKINEKSDS